MTTTLSPLARVRLPSTLDEIEGLFEQYPDAVLLEESVDYPGNLTAVPLSGEEGFVKAHGQFVSPRCLLNDPFMLAPFCEEMRKEGREVIAAPDAQPIIEDIERWAQPFLPRGFKGELFPYQQFSLRRAWSGLRSKHGRKTDSSSTGGLALARVSLRLRGSKSCSSTKRLLISCSCSRCGR